MLKGPERSVIFDRGFHTVRDPLERLEIVKNGLKLKSIYTKREALFSDKKDKKSLFCSKNRIELKKWDFGSQKCIKMSN